MVPCLSVITPVFNGQEFINRCYSLLQMQTFTDWEWVVVDDGSTDNTVKLLNQIKDPKVRVISYKPNKGRGYARTCALEAARGAWMVVWDIDDMYFPARLEKVNEARLYGYDFFCSYAILVNNNLQIKGVRGFHPPSNGLPRSFVHPTLACRLDIARKIGYDLCPTVGGIGEDYRILYTLAAKYRGFYLEDALTIYQEDREVFLKKTIDSNWSQLKVIRELYQRGILMINWKELLALSVKLASKLLILQLLRIKPSLYLRSVNWRSLGEKNPAWTLSSEQLAFIQQLQINETLLKKKIISSD